MLEFPIYLFWWPNKIIFRFVSIMSVNVSIFQQNRSFRVGIIDHDFAVSYIEL